MCAGGAQTADTPVAGYGAETLRAVLDHRESHVPGDAQDGLHVGRQTEHVNRQDRPGLVRNRAFNPARVDVVGTGVDIDQHRLRADVFDRLDRGCKRKRARDDLVARPDADAGNSQVQRIGAGSASHSMIHTEICGCGVFKCAYIAPEDVGSAACDLEYARIEFRGMLLVSSRQVQERYFHSLTSAS